MLQDDNDMVNKNQHVYGNEEGGTDHLKGLRIRLIFTINALGMLTDKFITVIGLTER